MNLLLALPLLSPTESDGQPVFGAELARRTIAVCSHSLSFCVCGSHRLKLDKLELPSDAQMQHRSPLFPTVLVFSNFARVLYG
jgi:hypothetical protein